MRLILCSARIPRVYTNGWIPRPLAWTRKKEGENGESMSAGIFTTSQGHKVVLSLCSWLSGKDGVRTHPRACTPLCDQYTYNRRTSTHPFCQLVSRRDTRIAIGHQPLNITLEPWTVTNLDIVRVKGDKPALQRYALLQ